ncbi:DsbA family protein [Nitrosomonas sp. ANs5]|uniref:DsbA family protein n=1 Tax=Nitrosomonas sp. ANs5 TaxID=3423941 RepID=UPI003D34CE9E
MVCGRPHVLMVLGVRACHRTNQNGILAASSYPAAAGRAPAKRTEILHHWQSVQATTGQPFNFENALPENFIYDTEPASRALISVALIEPSQVFPFFSAVQRAFYLEQVDVTQPDNLEKLAAGLHIPAASFIETFESGQVKQQTLGHFRRAAEWGITGFPALVAEKSARQRLITMGYCPYDALQQRLDAWLSS